MLASRRCIDGVNALSPDPHALTNTLRPSAKEHLAAGPGENPPAMFTARTIADPKRSSTASLTEAGILDHSIRGLCRSGIASKNLAQLAILLPTGFAAHNSTGG